MSYIDVKLHADQFNDLIAAALDDHETEDGSGNSLKGYDLNDFVTEETVIERINESIEDLRDNPQRGFDLNDYVRKEDIRDIIAEAMATINTDNTDTADATYDVPNDGGMTMTECPPTWFGILPVLLDRGWGNENSAKKRDIAQRQLRIMAETADRFNAMMERTNASHGAVHPGVEIATALIP